MRDRQRTQTHTHSELAVCALWLRLGAACIMLSGMADYGYGSSALLQCVQRRLCGGSAAALRQLSGSSAAVAAVLGVRISAQLCP